MAAEVALVDSAVWALISLRTCMLRAMFCAAPVCWRALPEMFCTRLAIWLETCSISSQRRARVLGEQRAADHVGGAALHRHHRLVGVGLDGAHQHLDLLGGVGGALGQALHLVGHHREAAPGLAGHRGLDRGVERQDVGLLGDVVDQLDDVADLLRALARGA